MKRTLGGVIILLSLAFAASAEAQPPAGEIISMNLSFPTYPSAPPYVGSYSGDFTASGTVVDAGSISAQALLAAVPSPSAGVLHTERTLTSPDGTLSLRCNEIAKSFTDLTAVPGTGTCVVLRATGAYATLRGSGKVTSIADLTTGAFTDALVLTTA